MKFIKMLGVHCLTVAMLRGGMTAGTGISGERDSILISSCSLFSSFSQQSRQKPFRLACWATIRVLPHSIHFPKAG